MSLHFNGNRSGGLRHRLWSRLQDSQYLVSGSSVILVLMELSQRQPPGALLRHVQKNPGVNLIGKYGEHSALDGSCQLVNGNIFPEETTLGADVTRVASVGQNRPETGDFELEQANLVAAPKEAAADAAELASHL